MKQYMSIKIQHLLHTNLIPIWVLLVSAGITISGCTSGNEPAGGGSSQKAHSGEAQSETTPHNHTGALHEIRESLANDEVLITGKQMENADIALGSVTRQQLAALVKSFGDVALAPSDEATVSAVIGGTCREIKVIEGDYVQKGEVIARIEHPDVVDMQQDFLQARSRSEYLKSEYQRQKRLHADSVNAQKTYQNATSEYRSNQALLQSLKQKLELIRIDTEQLTPETIRNAYPVLAPISGYVAQVKIVTGSHVTPQQSLFHITANEKAHIDLNIYEKDINKIAPGQKLTFNLANDPMAKPMQGEVVKMAKRFDSDQRTALTHAKILDKSENLLPGMGVVAYIQTGGKKQMTLPETAFVADQGQDYVFVLKEQGKMGNKHDHEEEKEHDPGKDAGHYFIFKRVAVDKGITEGTFAAFTLERQVDDATRFIVNNPQAVMAELKKGGGHSGHAH